MTIVSRFRNLPCGDHQQNAGVRWKEQNDRVFYLAPTFGRLGLRAILCPSPRFFHASPSTFVVSEPTVGVQC
jgi:hypothetical protein